ncbi:hypothetical protein Hanom_Chr17g01571041 [Helianthus anomalus]
MNLQVVTYDVIFFTQLNTTKKSKESKLKQNPLRILSNDPIQTTTKPNIYHEFTYAGFQFQNKTYTQKTCEHTQADTKASPK